MRWWAVNDWWSDAVPVYFVLGAEWNLAISPVCPSFSKYSGSWEIMETLLANSKWGPWLWCALSLFSRIRPDWLFSRDRCSNVREGYNFYLYPFRTVVFPHTPYEYSLFHPQFHPHQQFRTLFWICAVLLTSGVRWTFLDSGGSVELRIVSGFNMNFQIIWKWKFHQNTYNLRISILSSAFRKLYTSAF